MASRKPVITPNQKVAITRARFEIDALRTLLTAAHYCIAQMDAQDTTVHFSRAMDLKAALKSVMDLNNRFGITNLNELDAIINA